MQALHHSGSCCCTACAAAGKTIHLPVGPGVGSMGRQVRAGGAGGCAGAGQGAVRALGPCIGQGGVRIAPRQVAQLRQVGCKSHDMAAAGVGASTAHCGLRRKHPLRPPFHARLSRWVTVCWQDRLAAWGATMTSATHDIHKTVMTPPSKCKCNSCSGHALHNLPGSLPAVQCMVGGADPTQQCARTACAQPSVCLNSAWCRRRPQQLSQGLWAPEARDRDTTPCAITGHGFKEPT